MTWEHIGDIGVDTGMVIVADPCYLREERQLAVETRRAIEITGTPSLLTDWLAFCRSFTGTDHHTKMYKVFEQLPCGGQAITVRSGYGDGLYPVYIRRDREGLPAELRVVFIGEGPDQEEGK